jgi:hypothetical protein
MFSAAGATVAAVSALPEEVAGLLDEFRRHEILSVWKDLDFLRWRYQQHPEHTYDFHVLTREGKLEALVVSRQMGNSVAICELLHRSKNVAEAALLVCTVVRKHLSGQAQRIEFFGHDDGFFESVFARCRFRESYSASFVFGGRVFEDDHGLRQRFAFPRNWTVVYGDTDVV